jgi:CheY-like chemotaxis protein
LKSTESPLVLLAEDDSNDAFFVQRAFEHSGLPNRLVVVSDGRGVLDYLQGIGPYADRQSYPLPGLLLLDLKMPTMNGFEVLEWLQGRSEFNRLPVVILSGSGLSADVLRAEKLGADDYRVKTSNIKHLSQMLYELQARWLNGSRKGPPDAAIHL